MVTYDKLWLLSGKEAFGDSGSNNSVIRANEGSVYERITAQGITTSSYAKNAGYSESGSSNSRWLRSANRNGANGVYIVNYSGVWDLSSAYNTNGLAPGFSLKGSE